MAEMQASDSLPEVRLPTALTFAGLVAGLAAGAILQGSPALGSILTFAGPIGDLWLRALQMTILPLVAALLFVGVSKTAETASAGPMARRSLAFFAVILVLSGAMAAVLMPLLLAAFPAPAAAASALNVTPSMSDTPLPALADFLGGLIPTNVFAAAASASLLPLVVFMALFALAASRLPPVSRGSLLTLFRAIAGAMLILIGWVLALAPVGVFALALNVAATSGSAAIGVFAHYIVLVSAMGLAIVTAAYGAAFVLGRVRPAAFARAMLGPQAVAISTQSSLASLPAMLAACRKLELRELSADYVLPLAVALFRATSPAMNMAVVIYVAHVTGIELTPPVLAVGVAVSLLSSLGAPSLPGTISFIANIAPIALAMGVPVGPLALLVAVEVLPDIVRTLGNVTMDVAVTSAVDRKASGNPAAS
jgi:Na+/H+-dicarboxylate symporter